MSQRPAAPESVPAPSAAASDEPHEFDTLRAWVGVQRVANAPRPASTFEGRPGYLADFLGSDATVPLPTLGEGFEPADIARLADGSTELRYLHFSVVQHARRRVPVFSACNVDGSQLKSVPREDTWSFDGRIPESQQMLREAYGPQAEGRFSRGHMTRRQDPNWGTQAQARQANQDTFTATNACPQWQPFNDGLWGDLEDYLLGNAQGDRKKISVITGPVLSAQDPVRFGVQIPVDFWKVVAFISERTGALAAVGYVMSQRRFLQSTPQADPGQFELAQRSLRDIETLTGLHFGDLTRRDVMNAAPAGAVRAIRFLSDTQLPD